VASIPSEVLPSVPPVQQLAMYLITRVCPYLLDRSRFFLKRIALAQEWCFFLSKLGEVDEEECNIRGEEGILKIVKKINEWAVKHAAAERLKTL